MGSEKAGVGGSTPSLATIILKSLRIPYLTVCAQLRYGKRRLYIAWCTTIVHNCSLLVRLAELHSTML
jgi:hypothetical protein